MHWCYPWFYDNNSQKLCPSVHFYSFATYNWQSPTHYKLPRLPLWRLVTTAASPLAWIVVLGLARSPFRLLAKVVSCWRSSRRLFGQWGWWWGTVASRVEVRGRGIVVRGVRRWKGATWSLVVIVLLLRHPFHFRYLNAHTLCCSWLVECRFTAAAASLPPTTRLLLLVRFWKVTNIFASRATINI